MTNSDEDLTNLRWPDDKPPSFVAIGPMIHSCLPAVNAAAAAVPTKTVAQHMMLEAMRSQALAIEALYGEVSALRTDAHLLARMSRSRLLVG